MEIIIKAIVNLEDRRFCKGCRFLREADTYCSIYKEYPLRVGESFEMPKELRGEPIRSVRCIQESQEYKGDGK
jgi:hypothetical protein